MRLLGFLVSGVLALAVGVGAFAQEAPYFRFGKFGEGGTDPTNSLTVQAPGSAYTLRVNRSATVPGPTVSNHAGPFSWSLESGPLPSGMSIGGGGEISGTPDTVGYFGGIRLRAYSSDNRQGASGAYALSVIGLPSISYVNLTTARDQNVRLGPNLTNVTSGANYQMVGSVPGLSLVNGVLTGVASTPGTYAGLQVRVTDFDGETALSAPFTVTVLDATASVTVANGTGRVDIPFSLQFAQTGLAAPIQWSLVSGTQPAGLEIDQGYPGFRGTSTSGASASGLVVRAVDANGLTAWSNAFSISIAPVSISYPVASASLGVPFSLSPQSQNLLQGASWVLSRGALPTGLELSTATGAITGTPRAEGSFAGIVVSAIDAGGTYASAPFTISVTADAIGVTASSARTRVATPFEAPLTAANSTGPVTWTLKSGNLPTGLAIDSSAGKIAGTPTQEVNATGLVVEATDANGLKGVSQPFAINVIPQPVAVAQPVYTLRRGVQSSTKIQALNILGSERWQPSPGVIVPGVTLDASGNLVGTPMQTAFVDNIKATVTDTADGANGTSAPFSVQVEEPPAATMTVTGVWPTYNVRQGNQIVMTLPSAAPASGPLTWSLGAGTLPTGLGINPASGRIEGFAATVGTTSALRLRATDGASTANSTPFSVAVTGPLQASVSSATVKRGDAMSVTPTLTGRIGMTTWTLSGGRLPVGLGFDGNSGRLSGVPTEAGTFPNLVLSVTDAFDGATAQTQPFTIEVSPGLIVRGPSSLSAKAGVPFTSGGSFTVDGATNPVSWTMVQPGPLPIGLGLSPSTGVISGTPTTEGLHSAYRMRVTDANGLTGETASFSIRVTGSLRVLVAPQQNFIRNKASGFTPATENAVGAVTWSIESGGLPPGLAFNAGTGRIAGVPTADGQWSLRLRATDSTTATALSDGFTIFVRNGITMTLNHGNYIYGREGLAYTVPAPTVVGNVGAVTFDWAPTVPTPSRGSLNLDPATGVVTGPLPSDSWYWNIRATDSQGNQAQDYYFVDSTPPVDNQGGGVGGGQRTRYGQVGKSFQFYTGTTSRPYVFNILDKAVFSVGSGTLPSWATLDPDTGNITGTPDVPGTTTVFVRACDTRDNNCDDASHTIIITPAYQTPTHMYLTGRANRIFNKPNVVTIPSGFVWTDLRIDYPAYATNIYLNSTRTGFGGTYPNPGFYKDFRVLAERYSNGGYLRDYQYFDVDIANELGIENRYAYRCHRRGVDIGFPVPAVFGQRGTVTHAMTNTLNSNVSIAGLSFDATTGVLSGTPTANYDGVLRFRITDDWDSESFYYEQRIRIRPQLTVNATPAMRTGNAGDYIFSGLGFTGYYGTPIARVKSGALPKGISVTSAGAGGYLQGTYEEAGVFSAVIEMEDVECDGAKVETTVNFNIGAKILPKASDMYARVGVEGRATPMPSLSYAGNPVKWTHFSGTLPSGLAVDSATGELVGTPRASGTYNNLRLMAEDSSGIGYTDYFKVTVSPGPAIDYGAARFDYHINEQVSLAPSVSNSMGTMSFGVSGTLPQGVSFNPASGAISGTAQAVADANLTVTMSDSGGATAAPVQVRIVVDPTPVGTWVPDRMLNCVNGDGRFACLQGYSCSTTLCTSPNPSGHVCTTDGAWSNGAMPQCYGVFAFQ